MERESLLTLLIVLLGGVTLQLFAALPWRDGCDAASRRLERQRWLALWWPTVPTTVVAAWLCGWALSQPDPVLDTVSPVLFVACAPFAAFILRAVVRAVWSLACSPGDCGVATVGILRPHIVFSPQLVVQARIARLLQPLPDAALSGEASRVGVTTASLVLSSVMALVLGLVCGESVIRPLLRL